jgi:hypothetical protein
MKDGKEVEIRRKWQINPAVRIKESEKTYKRAGSKERLRKIVKEEN